MKMVRLSIIGNPVPIDSPDACSDVQLAVGRLGIITQVTMGIVPNIQVERSLQQLTTQQFIDQIKRTQDKYVQALQEGSSAAVAEALAELDETQVRQLHVRTSLAAAISLTESLESMNLNDLKPIGY